MDISTDKMYRIASLINATPTFTIAYLQELLEVDQCPDDEVDLLIGRLVRRRLLHVSDQPQFVFDETTHDISTIIVNKYQLFEERRDEFDQYLRELRQERVRPEQNGRPRGLCYRVLEELIESVINNPTSLEDERTCEETEAQVEQYLAAAEAEEISNPRYDSRQKKLSEAYLRELYGSYLKAKKEWLPAIRQYLRASLLFLDHGYGEKKRNLEVCIIEILQHIWDTCDENRLDILTQVEDSIKEYTGKYIALLLAVTSINSRINKPAKPKNLPSSLANQEPTMPLQDEGELIQDEEEITTADRQRVTDVPQPFDELDLLEDWPRSVQDTDAIPVISSSIRDQINYPFQKDLTVSSPDKITKQESSNKNNDIVGEALLELAGVAA